MKKVQGVKLGGKYGGNKVSKAKTENHMDTGDSKGVRIPRYHSPNFKPVRTPDSSGMIKQCLGGVVENGILKYPEHVDVDPVHAAKAQAYFDYNQESGIPKYRPEMAEIYGEAYTKEFERLKTAKNGPSAWRGGKRG